MGLHERYPDRKLYPFASRDDNDDLACFLPNGQVVVIHDFASAGYEGGTVELDFVAWLKSIMHDLICTIEIS